MKSFEITTPGLKEAAETFSAVIKGAGDGTLEKEQARNMIAAGNGITRTHATELSIRLAMPKLLAMEAKMIEAEQHKKLEAA